MLFKFVNILYGRSHIIDMKYDIKKVIPSNKVLIGTTCFEKKIHEVLNCINVGVIS